jgi:hypothetical protein
MASYNRPGESMIDRFDIVNSVAQDSGYMPDAPIGLTLLVFAIIIVLTVLGFILAARLVPKDRANSGDTRHEVDD